MVCVHFIRQCIIYTIFVVSRAGHRHHLYLVYYVIKYADAESCELNDFAWLGICKMQAVGDGGWY